jgi:rod shape-determining protein MreD
MTYALDIAKVGALLFVAALLQVTLVAAMDPLGGTPDLLLVVLVGLALLRGPIVGAIGGFFAGLIVDTATLATLGLTSLLLSLAGYWIGRYGETTGRDRVHAPLLSVFVATILYSIGAYLLHFVLGDAVSARMVLVDSMPPIVLWNLLLALPVLALCRRLLKPIELAGRARDVRLLG